MNERYTWTNWRTQREHRDLLAAWLEANGYSVNSQNISLLIEAGFLDKVKQLGKKAILPVALAAGLGAGGNYGVNKNAPQPTNTGPAQRYSVSGELAYRDPVAMNNFNQDVASMEKYGHEVALPQRGVGPVQIKMIEEAFNESFRNQHVDMFVSVTRSQQQGEGTMLM